MRKPQTGCNTATTTYKIPAGEDRWFVLRATIATVEAAAGTETLTVQLDGDAAFPARAIPPNTVMHNATTTDADTNDDFIWSPNSTTTSNARADLDFTNGYGLVGLPSTNMDAETLTSAN